MKSEPPLTRDWLARPTLYPERAVWLRRADAIAQLVGVSVAVIGHGQRRNGIPPWEFGLVPLLAMAVITGAIALRYRWSLKQATFARRYLSTVLAAACWITGMVAVTILGPLFPDLNGAATGDSRWWGYVNLSEIILALYCISGFTRGLRAAASGGTNPALVLSASFAVLIGVGTVVLMLPICRQFPPNVPLVGAPWHVALFTSASASCVTGLIVVDTATYWSPIGHLVIMILFQIGGLGIMTFGVLFAAIAGRNVRLTEYATLKDLFASEGLGNLRHLILAILGFTAAAELAGALMLWTYWTDLPPLKRAFFSLFHAVSAFCNAGFALDNFEGRARHWQVAGVIPSLIIVGGLGFAVLYNLSSVAWNSVTRATSRTAFRFPRDRVRLRLTTKLVLLTTAVLLVSGTAAIYLLERTSADNTEPIGLADAWFQSVTFRTAGFNTVDLSRLTSATKLTAIVLMTIGASPGSTGGGIKTTVFAVGVVSLLSVLRGRERVEAFDRTIPAVNVNRAMAILFVFVMTVLAATLCVVVFEHRSELFLDYVFEVTSAAGTVGVSSGFELPSGEMTSITRSLSQPSQLIIILTMFLGRVGPLTLLLALAGEAPAIRYEYPPERVTLG